VCMYNLFMRIQLVGYEADSVSKNDEMACLSLPGKLLTSLHFGFRKRGNKNGVLLFYRKKAWGKWWR